VTWSNFVFLSYFTLALSTQTYPLPIPPTPPPLIHDWAAYYPLANSHRVTVQCREGGRFTAEFDRKGDVVSVVAIEGFSRRLSKNDRTAIDAALAPLGGLDRVAINCNGPNTAVIAVLGGFEQINGKMLRKQVQIVWGRSGLTGTEGRKLPKMELSPNPL